MRLFGRTRTADIDSVPALYRSPFAVNSLPTADVTARGSDLGIDLYAIDRALSGEHPQPRLTEPEARAAFALIRNPMELWASEIATALNVHVRTVVRWRQATPTTPEGDDMETAPTRWRDSAYCRSSDDPEKWFPLGYTPPYVPQIEAARAECSLCPVRRECREAAMVEEGARGRDNRYGIRGGMTPSERAGLYLRRKRARERARAREQEIAATVEVAA